MLAASILLALLAFALAWPVPIALSRATWPTRAPATALLLWQAIALAGGLSMIGSLLTFGLVPFGNTLLRSAGELVRYLLSGTTVAPVELVYLLSLSAAALLAAHLLLNLVRTIVVTERQRRRHRQLIEMLSTPSPDLPNTRLIDHEVPVAYCLPGSPHSITVFSAGLLSLLDQSELRAVIEHEKAHLLQRHYIVLMFFEAWRNSLPWFPTATRAHNGVGMLVEMLADDRARRVVDDRTVAAAITLVSGRSGASGILRDVDPSWKGFELGERGGRSGETLAVAQRVGRLASLKHPLPLPGRIGVALAAFALVLVPTLLLFAPTIA